MNIYPALKPQNPKTPKPRDLYIVEDMSGLLLYEFNC